MLLSCFQEVSTWLQGAQLELHPSPSSPCPTYAIHYLGALQACGCKCFALGLLHHRSCTVEQVVHCHSHTVFVINACIEHSTVFVGRQRSSLIAGPPSASVGGQATVSARCWFCDSRSNPRVLVVATHLVSWYLSPLRPPCQAVACSTLSGGLMFTWTLIE